MPKKNSKKQLAVMRDDLAIDLADLLRIHSVRDYCPNGLQVQGKKQIKKIVTGVTASLDLIQAAIDRKADAILVHHGWFWKNDEPAVVGLQHARLKLLIEHDINLFAYHLPLDVHPELGNNAQLAKLMNWSVTGQNKKSDVALQGTSMSQSVPMEGLIFKGKPSAHQKTLGQLARALAMKLGRDPLVCGDVSKPIKTIAWCTGAAQGYMQEAIKMGVSAYISGEVSEQTYHLAKESGVAYIAAGHHATERYGIQALGEHLQKKLGVSCEFVDISNPV